MGEAGGGGGRINCRRTFLQFTITGGVSSLDEFGGGGSLLIGGLRWHITRGSKFEQRQKTERGSLFASLGVSACFCCGVIAFFTSECRGMSPKHD